MGNRRAGSSGPGGRLISASLPVLALLFPTGAARPAMRLVSRDSLPATGTGTAMDLDVTSLSHRRAVRRWERVSVGDVLERLTWSYPDQEAIVGWPGRSRTPCHFSLNRSSRGAADLWSASWLVGCHR